MTRRLGSENGRVIDERDGWQQSITWGVPDEKFIEEKEVLEGIPRKRDVGRGLQKPFVFVAPQCKKPHPLSQIGSFGRTRKCRKKSRLGDIE